jgi:uncharacterized protein YaiL (DUF2058 family)
MSSEGAGEIACGGMRRVYLAGRTGIQGFATRVTDLLHPFGRRPLNTLRVGPIIAAMQDLRDKLRKAGLVDKTQAREARTQARRERRRGAHDLDEPQRPSERHAALARRTSELQQQLNREREERERLARLRDLIRAHAVLRPDAGDRPFYFVGQDRRVRRLTTSHELAAQLTRGQLAIVEVDDDPRHDYALVDAATAARLEELDRARILFWCKPAAGDGDLPAYGSGT